MGVWHLMENSFFVLFLGRFFFFNLKGIILDVIIFVYFLVLERNLNLFLCCGPLWQYGETLWIPFWNSIIRPSKELNI